MKKAITFVGALSLPMLALAQATAQSILVTIGGLVNLLTVIVVALALLAFLWGLMMYLFGGAGAKADEGRQIMIWGVIALFVMVAVWGLVQVIANTFGVATGGTAPIPGVIGTGGTTGGFGGFGGNTSGGATIGGNIFANFPL